jgi:hypothetical protein
MITRVLIGALVATLSISSVARGQELLLGMLEDVPGIYAGESNSSKVRVLFVHKGSAWSAYRTECSDLECLKTVTREYPAEVAWFVGLDGRQLGQIVARTPKEFRAYAHIGLQDIVQGTAPIVGKPSYEFSGFPGREIHRPLVTVSKPYFKDPAQWKRMKVTPDLRQRALALLQSKVPRLCTYPPKGDSLVPLTYSAKDLRVRAHQSLSGSLTVSINIRNAYYCGDAPGDALLDAHAFAVAASGQTRFLGPGLMLVDAGDYDQDGRSELIFALSLYNRGGYVLFAEDFSEQARFEFGYH